MEDKEIKIQYKQYIISTSFIYNKYLFVPVTECCTRGYFNLKLAACILKYNILDPKTGNNEILWKDNSDSRIKIDVHGVYFFPFTNHLSVFETFYLFFLSEIEKISMNI